MKINNSFKLLGGCAIAILLFALIAITFFHDSTSTTEYVDANSQSNASARHFLTSSIEQQLRDDVASLNSPPVTIHELKETAIEGISMSLYVYDHDTHSYQMESIATDVAHDICHQTNFKCPVEVNIARSLSPLSNKLDYFGKAVLVTGRKNIKFVLPP